MSIIRTLKDKFKAVQEVTSLSTDDKVMVVSSDGSPKRIGEGNLKGNIVQGSIGTDAPASGRWVRILKVYSSSTGLVSLNNVWSSSSPQPMAFLYLGAHRLNISYAKVVVFATSSYYKRLRVVAPADSDACYLEVFMVNFPANNPLVLSVSGNLNVPQSFTSGEVPSGANVKEFDLTTSAFDIVGGGKYQSFSKLCNLAERRVA